MVIPYLIYYIRRIKTSEGNAENNEYPNNYDDVYVVPVDELSNYTALARPGEYENADHIYCHLNKVHINNVNQEENGI